MHLRGGEVTASPQRDTVLAVSIRSDHDNLDCAVRLANRNGHCMSAERPSRNKVDCAVAWSATQTGNKMKGRKARKLEVRRTRPDKMKIGEVRDNERPGGAAAPEPPAPRRLGEYAARSAASPKHPVTATVSTSNILEASTGVECEPEAMAKALLR